MCTIAVRWASAIGTTSTEVWSTTAFFSSSAAGLRPVYKNSTLSLVSAFFILLRRSLSAQCVTPARSFKARWKERTNPTWTDKPSSSLLVLVEGEAAINPSQTLLLLVHLSRFESLLFVLERVDKQSARRRTTLSKSICDCAQFYSRVQHRAHWRTEVSVYHALCFTEVVVKMLGSWSRRQWPTGTDLCLMLCWRKELHDVQEMIRYGWTDRAYLKLLTKIGKNLLILDTICKNFSGGKPRTPTFLKSNSPQYPLGYAPVHLFSLLFLSLLSFLSLSLSHSLILSLSLSRNSLSWSGAAHQRSNSPLEWKSHRLWGLAQLQFRLSVSWFISPTLLCGWTLARQRTTMWRWIGHIQLSSNKTSWYLLGLRSRRFFFFFF